MTTQKYEIILSRKHELVALPGITVAELSRLSECHPTVTRRLLAIGLIEPVKPGGEPLFDRSVVVRTRKALRLKRDLGLNLNSVALVMELLDKIEELEHKVRHASTL